MQLYTNDNRRAVLILHKDAQEDKVAGIVDTYELGDHLDALLRWSADSEEALRHLLSEEQIEISRIEVELPTIENVFLLHAMKQGVQDAAVTDLTALRRDKATRKSGTAVRAENLGRKFASFQAVKSLNLKVKYGEIYGLLGANGAGKTTTIKILCGLINASSGKVQLAEESEDLRNSELRKRTGYMSQKSTLYADLTVRENLEFYNSVYKVPNDRRGDMVEWALSNCGLTGRGEELISNLPKGLTQRVAFAAAVMHTPDILFLDEPSSGVDPAARRQLWHMIRALAEDGTAVIVTTHGLDEAEYCNRLGIMSGGELLVEGTPSELRESEQSDTLEEAFIKLVGRRGGR